jgi:hypothetical protein
MRDRLEHVRTVDLCNPMNRLVGHPLAPFLTVPQPPLAEESLSTIMDPSPSRGLQTPMVLAPPGQLLT